MLSTRLHRQLLTAPDACVCVRLLSSDVPTRLCEHAELVRAPLARHAAAERRQYWQPANAGTQTLAARAARRGEGGTVARRFSLTAAPARGW